MTPQVNIPDSLEAFFANALGLEYECERRLIDLSRSLEAHHNLEAAEIFSRAEQMRAQNIDTIGKQCEAFELPRIAPWDYHWHQHFNIERICIDEVYYLITPHEAIELIQLKLDAVSEFYRQVQAGTDQQEIGEAAQDILELLAAEKKIVASWEGQYEVIERLADLDPPNQPE